MSWSPSRKCNRKIHVWKWRFLTGKSLRRLFDLPFIGEKAFSSNEAKRWYEEAEALRRHNEKLSTALEETHEHVEEWKRQLQFYRDECARLRQTVTKIEAMMAENSPSLSCHSKHLHRWLACSGHQASFDKQYRYKWDWTTANSLGSCWSTTQRARNCMDSIHLYEQWLISSLENSSIRKAHSTWPRSNRITEKTLGGMIRRGLLRRWTLCWTSRRVKWTTTIFATEWKTHIQRESICTYIHLVGVGHN